MKSPLILPWLARKWGVSDTRTLEIWIQACRDADAAIINRSSSEYWKFAKNRLFDLLDREVLLHCPATETAGQMINLSILRWFAWLKFWLAKRVDSLSHA